MTTVRLVDIKVLPGSGPYCNRGARAFFQRHGLDWRDFLFNGIDAATLVALDDAMAMQAVLAAETREAAGGEP